MSRLKVGILGLNRGVRTAEIVAGFSKNVEVAVLCDRKPELRDRAAQKIPGVPLAAEYDELLQSKEIDAVYIASGIPEHAEHAIAAFRAGKHVISEVTALTDIRDCQRLLDAKRSSAKLYMLAENYCYMRSWRTVMNMVKDGLFGEIYYGEGDYVMDFRGRAGFPYIGGWRQNVYHMHRGHVYITHSLGPLAEAFGNEPVTRVCCMGSGSHPRQWGLKADNTCTLLCQTESGKMIRLRQDFLSPRPSNFLYYAIQGTKGVYEGGHGYGGSFHEGPRGETAETVVYKVHLSGKSGGGEWNDLSEFSEYEPSGDNWVPKERVKEYGVYNEGVAVMFDEFAEAIRTRCPETPVSLKHALNWTAAGLLSEQSAEQNGMPVEVPVF